jgi:hypothetical protein
VGTADTPVQVLVCVPDQSGTLQASQSPCPPSPISSLQVVSGVVLSPADYDNLLAYDGPVSQSEGQSLAMTCAGMVVALYLVSLGVGLVVRLIKQA